MRSTKKTPPTAGQAIRPLTLYVQKVEPNPSMDGLFVPPVREIDMEMDKPEAQIVFDALKNYLNNVTAGTIRIRYIGRPVQ